MKGETPDEIVGIASALRSRMVSIDLPHPQAVDTCGTGGDGSGSVNISTLAAFVVAGSGGVVAKHGNRALSSKSGSHDVLEALGLSAAPSPDKLKTCFQKVGLGFMFAPAFHAATKSAAGPRKELGFRTAFNLLGPLTNPAQVAFAVNGVFAADRCALLARAHGALGTKRAFVVHGHGGIDEFAVDGPTVVAEWTGKTVLTSEVTPADFGLSDADANGLKGGDLVKTPTSCLRSCGETVPSRYGMRHL